MPKRSLTTLARTSTALARASTALALFLAPLAGACRGPHECGPACESGLVPSGARSAHAGSATSAAAGDAPAAAAVAVSEPASEAPAQELSSADALAAFDEAWQSIHDTHFDTDFNGVDWNAVREELRPRAERARTRSEVREVIAEMLGRLEQSHFAVIPADALPSDGGARDQSGGLGFDVRLRDGRLYVVSLEPGGAALEAGVELGWDVREIGDFSVERALERMRAAEELGERKLAFALWTAALGQVHGAVGGTERVAFLDGEDRPVSLELERRARPVTAHEFGASLPTFYLEFDSEILERDGKKVGRFSFSNWFLPVMAEIDAAVERMRACDGVVIDLRGNTGGVAAMTMGVGGHFFAESKKLGTMITRDSTMNILAIPRRVNAAGELVEPFAGPLAILVDETTGSASEVFAGGMQSVGRARVFGETTAGAVLPAVTTSLPNGDVLLHALGDFETSTGARLEGVGVVPDQPVPLARADLLAGRDAALEAALEWITSAER